MADISKTVPEYLNVFNKVISLIYKIFFSLIFFSTFTPFNHYLRIPIYNFILTNPNYAI